MAVLVAKRRTLEVPWRSHSAARAARPSLKELALLAALSLAALLVHGYHGAAEDAEIYVPGILKLLRPSLFPYNDQFFASHAGMTLFPHLIAGTVTLFHLHVGAALLAWQVVSIFLLLLASWRIARLCFTGSAVWSAVALVAAMLTLPVAGTALYLMDQYVTSRSFSTPGALMAVAAVLEGRYVEAALWLLFTAAVHPMMAVFAAALLALLILPRRGAAPAGVLPALVPVFPPVTSAYRQVLREHPYFLLTNWAWYEWLGILAPFAVLGGMAALARRYRLGPMERVCHALMAFEAFFLGAALIISLPGRFERFAEIQPMRCLHLLYALMLLFGGGLLGQFVLRRHAWRWALLFAPLSAGMCLTQLQLFPATPHVEWPWAAPRNPWMQAFVWIRHHTPENAYFALPPDYATQPQEDWQGFRAVARRSMLADDGKDSGAVSMFPALAGQWDAQVRASRGWRQFQRADFQRLKSRYGVDWVVLARPAAASLPCPYHNDLLLVCRIE